MFTHQQGALFYFSSTEARCAWMGVHELFTHRPCTRKRVVFITAPNHNARAMLFHSIPAIATCKYLRPTVNNMPYTTDVLVGNVLNTLVASETTTLEIDFYINVML